MSHHKLISGDPENTGRAQFSSSSDLIGILASRAPRVALALASGQASWPWFKKGKNYVSNRRVYTVKVPGGHGSDGLYDELHEWMLSLLPPDQQKALVAYAARSNRVHEAVDDFPHRRRSDNDASRIRLRYDGSREQSITVRGHKIKISVTDGSPAGGDNKSWRPPEVVFSATSLAGRDAVILEISSILKASLLQSRIPVFRMLNQWDEWERIDDLPPRSLGSVILPDDQLERLTSDISRFLGSESAYSRRSVPWHRGHLYEGPPGTGKTSLARALACHFGLDMWYLTLAGIKSDSNLIKIIMNVKARSILLLEDIDVFHAATARGDELGGTTLSGLLNALDGIATPHGLITIMTSNNPDILDPALLRAGRVDLIEHFGLSGPDEIVRFIMHWYDLSSEKLENILGLERLPAEFRLTAADVTEICKQHEIAAGAIDSILNEASGRGK